MREEWDLYTRERARTGLVHCRGDEMPKGLYHIVVEVWTIVDHERVLLTQRHPDKPFGLLWECTGGSILRNEDSVEGAIREVREEIGIDTREADLEKVFEYVGEDCIYDVYVTYQDEGCLKRMKLQEEEVVDVKCVSYDEFKDLLMENDVVPKLAYFTELVKNGSICLEPASG